jgi:FkbM family methyltransferase
LYTNKSCNPEKDNVCNKLALIIGIIYIYNIIDCRPIPKKDKFYYISIFISFYIIISHIIAIYPIKGKFMYKGILLDILNLKSYILILSDLFHEVKLRKEIEKIVDNTKCDAIIDAGAYIGDSFIFLAKKYKHKKFYMIEPSNDNFNFIKKIKSDNNLDNVILFNFLLSNDEEIYKGYDVNEPNAKYIKNKTGIRSEVVDNLKFKGKINEKIGLMHYDVEGMELEVLLGSIQTINEDKPIIIVEMLGINKNKNEKVENLLTKSGYRKRIVNENCAAGDIFDLKKCRNYIFEPI